MTFGDVVRYFGTVFSAALELDYKAAEIYQWQNSGIPLRSQRTIEHVTNGQLKADKK